MEIVRDILLVLAFVGISLFGYFVMSRLDRFLDGNRKSIEQDSEKRGPRCVMLTEELSNEEIAEEVERFKKRHKRVRIMLYDNSDAELSEKIENHNE